MKTHTQGPKRDRHDGNGNPVISSLYDGWTEFDAAHWLTEDELAIPITLTLNPMREASESEILRALDCLESLG